MESITANEFQSSSAHVQLAKQYVTFRVDRMFFGVDVSEVQEIIRHQPMTPVPLAPKTVRGLVNLRGQIITAIDMRSMLRLDRYADDSSPMNVVIRAGGETLSLLVDAIGDVIDVDHSTYEVTPETIAPHIAFVIDGVFKLEKELLLILKTESCTSTEHL